MFRREGGVGGGGYFRLMKAKGEDKSSDWQPARQRGLPRLNNHRIICICRCAGYPPRDGKRDRQFV